MQTSRSLTLRLACKWIVLGVWCATVYAWCVMTCCEVSTALHMHTWNAAGLVAALVPFVRRRVDCQRVVSNCAGLVLLDLERRATFGVKPQDHSPFAFNTVRTQEFKLAGMHADFFRFVCTFALCLQALTADDLQPALLDMKRKLMERNVAEQIAQNICDSIARFACARGCVNARP